MPRQLRSRKNGQVLLNIGQLKKKNDNEEAGPLGRVLGGQEKRTTEAGTNPVLEVSCARRGQQVGPRGVSSRDGLTGSGGRPGRGSLAQDARCTGSLGDEGEGEGRQGRCRGGTKGIPRCDRKVRVWSRLSLREASGPRAARGRPPAPPPALGRAGAQGAGALPQCAGGGDATPARQGPLWCGRAGPRCRGRGSPVPLGHGLAGLAG